MHQRAVGQAGRKGVVQMHFLSIEQLKMVLPLHCPPTGPGEMAGSIEECEETALESLSEHFKVKHLSECPNKDLLKYPIPGLIYGIGKRLVVPLRVRAHRKSLADPESTDLIVYFIVDSGSPMTSFAPKTAEKLFGERALGSAIIQDRNVYCGSSEDFSAAMKNVNLLGSYFLRQLQTSIIVSPHPHDYLPDARVFYLTPISKISRAQKMAASRQQSVDLVKKLEDRVVNKLSSLDVSGNQQKVVEKAFPPLEKSDDSRPSTSLTSSSDTQMPSQHGSSMDFECEETVLKWLSEHFKVKHLSECPNKDLLKYPIPGLIHGMNILEKKTAEKLFGGKNFDTAIIQDVSVSCSRSEDFGAALKDVNLLGNDFLTRLDASIIVSPHPYKNKYDADRVFYLTPFPLISQAQTLVSRRQQSVDLVKKLEDRVVNKLSSLDVSGNQQKVVEKAFPPLEKSDDSRPSTSLTSSSDTQMPSQHGSSMDLS
ncbi:hypothetical protein M3Y95_00238500 [Aphelenchoides besseyi]|nr:hypothetical protein M3Y95_00238500 [Aphelenchoides besseyi]